MCKFLFLAWILVASCTKIVALKQIKDSYPAPKTDSVQPTPPVVAPVPPSNSQTKIDV